MALFKKYWWLFVILIVLVGYLGYRGRHRIKVFLGMAATPAPAATQTTSESVPSTAVAPSGNIYTTKTDSTKGDYLADFQGMTLYVFDKDTSGVSNCSGSCATLWPPYTSGATAQTNLPANITVITRSDGSSQFAWMGKPLYYYSKDQKVGDILGDGVGGIWHLVKP